MLFASLRRYREAAATFRSLLDEKPDANRVRLELARVLALMGDEEGSRRQFRQAQAAGLPPDVAITVGRFINALRSSRPVGGSLEVALVPDSNINRATKAASIDTVIAPLTLDQDARAHSGLGLRGSAEVYGRFSVADGLSLLARGFGQAILFRDSQFDDISAGISLGPEIRAAGNRWRPALGIGRRYYGGNLYATTRSASLNWLHPTDKRSQIAVDLAASRARYPANWLQNGMVYDASVSFERGFTSRSGASLTLSGNRQTSRDPGYATRSASLSTLLWREIGTVTVYGTASYRHLASDRRLSLYPRPRTDDYVRIGVGASLRKLALGGGLAPIVRVSFERNRSAVELYDYRRTAVEFGLAKAF